MQSETPQRHASEDMSIKVGENLDEERGNLAGLGQLKRINAGKTSRFCFLVNPQVLQVLQVVFMFIRAEFCCLQTCEKFRSERFSPRLMRR